METKVGNIHPLNIIQYDSEYTTHGFCFGSFEGKFNRHLIFVADYQNKPCKGLKKNTGSFIKFKRKFMDES